MVNVNIIIGSNIRNFRKLYKLTQPELADLIGKHVNTLRKYENGVISVPNDILIKLSEVFNISVDELLSTEKWERDNDKSVPDFEKFNQQVNIDNLVDNIKLCELVSKHYGSDTLELMIQFQELNLKGKNRITEVMEDILQLEKYTK